MFTSVRRTALLVLALLMTLAAGSPGAVTVQAAPDMKAVVVSESHVADRQVDLAVRSASLGGGTVNVRLLTPDGWEVRDRRDRWPVLYLLHGCCGDYTSWTAMTDVAEIPALRDVLVVMPEGGDSGWYSDWWNSGQGGSPAWETFHLQELRPLLEQSYGAGTQRVVAGLSMGGLGALLYAGRNPGMFRAAASYSGMVHPLSESGIRWSRHFMTTYGHDPDRLWGDPVGQREIWEQHDPFHLAKELRNIPVHLSSGDGNAGPLDPAGAPFSALERDFLHQNLQVAAAIEAVGGDVTTDFYGAGGHGWGYWERELRDSLPKLLGALHVGRA
ncbi:esterase [Knoellia sinensis KCTC 19936]|uniref:Esterase n=1 Tax=Knoellia sinensis KCTC 19936 TaxID=1385520 RepID=A0A0A0J6H9_9MICO|nr:alpha/beta hydrolase family protein [Knoellia sinensis]KGN31667.1 esterase [Knoellia sinensis KCTC 19936]